MAESIIRAQVASRVNETQVIKLRYCNAILSPHCADRTQVANMDMKDVISNRELMRSVARDSMLKVVGGWGVWLETVEITDVKILSRQVTDF
jgi:hypothetical protein